MESSIPEKREKRMGAILPPIRISIELKRRMQQYAIKHDISLSELQRQALLAFLDREEGNGNWQAE